MWFRILVFCDDQVLRPCIALSASGLAVFSWLPRMIVNSGRKCEVSGLFCKGDHGISFLRNAFVCVMPASFVHTESV